MTYISEDGGIWQDQPRPGPDWDALSARLGEMTYADRLEAVRRYLRARYARPPGDAPVAGERPGQEAS